jgi:hypothetical protein
MLVTDHAFACSAPIIRVPQLGRWAMKTTKTARDDHRGDKSP